MIKGLGKYTVESGLIYFKSLLRGSIVYAAESMVSMKESDIRMIEKAEENTLRDFESKQKLVLPVIYCI